MPQQKPFSFAMSAVVAILLVVSLAGSSVAQGKVQRSLLDPKAIEKWADEVFGKALAEHRVAGMGFTVTLNDKVLFMKSYGYEDWASKTPVMVDKTRFRIASLTKTFVAAAVAQLLERGKIASLDDPVNKYVKRTQFKPNGGQDITLWDLLTHRAGFGGGPNADVPATMTLPLPGEFIAANTPGYARPRDQISVYCNFCTGVLGIMIEDVSGKTLPDYLRENIFLPLGMNNTEMSVTRTAPPNMITQYAFVPNGPAVALPYPTTTVLTPAAGAIISTTADMSKWLIANIGQGEGIGKAILQPRSWKLMHTRHRGNHPDTNGFGMQFFIYDYNGEKVMEQYGSLQHRSMEFMLMDSKVGIFVTMAGGGRPGAQVQIPKDAKATVTGPVEPAVSHSGVRALILERFLGTLPVKKEMKAELAKYTGRYQDIPRTPNPSNPQPGREVTVTDSGDGGLVIDGRGVYRPSGPHAFTLDRPLEWDAGFGVNNKYVFATDASGAVTAMYGHVNAGGFQRVGQQ